MSLPWVPLPGPHPFYVHGGVVAVAADVVARQMAWAAQETADRALGSGCRLASVRLPALLPGVPVTVRVGWSAPVSTDGLLVEACAGFGLPDGTVLTVTGVDEAGCDVRVTAPTPVVAGGVLLAHATW